MTPCAHCGQSITEQAAQTPRGWMHVHCARAVYGAPPKPPPAEAFGRMLRESVATGPARVKLALATLVLAGSGWLVANVGDIAKKRRDAADCETYRSRVYAAVKADDVDGAERLLGSIRGACGGEDPGGVATKIKAWVDARRAARRAEAAAARAPVTECGEKASGVGWDCPEPSGNPMPLLTFKATSHATPTVFKLSGQISDYYNYQYRGAEKTHYAVELREGGSFTPRVHAYIRRDAPTATELFTALSDGMPHTVTVELVYEPSARTNDVTKMSRFVKRGW